MDNVWALEKRKSGLGCSECIAGLDMHSTYFWRQERTAKPQGKNTMAEKNAARSTAQARLGKQAEHAGGDRIPDDRCFPISQSDC